MTLESLRTVLRLRTLVPTGINPVQRDVIDQLQQLQNKGVITELDIDIWGSSMGMTFSGNRDPTGTRQLISEFERWADEHDCTLRPAFAQSGAKSSNSGDEIERQTEYAVLPLLCLAIYGDTTVQAVYPHMRSDGIRTIHDGVAALDSMRPATDQINVETGGPSVAMASDLKQK